ncbi:hypothetical protein XPA_005120 [Xanthoria parietina]
MSLSLSPPSNDSGPSAKPVRLRAACNPCHDAKLRCSGERDGCTRCRSLNHLYACKYSLSRVGKASSRNKRDQSPDEAEPSGLNVIPRKEFNIQDLLADQSIDWAALNGDLPYINIPGLVRAGPDSYSLPQPQANKKCPPPFTSPLELGSGAIPLDFATQSLIPPSGCRPTEAYLPMSPVPGPAFTRDPQQQLQHNLELSRSQPGYFDCVNSSTPPDQPSLSYSPSVTSAASSNTKSNTGNASQCISLCIQIISHLETQANDSDLGLDGVLRLSKSCIGGLHQITTLDGCKLNPNCLLLLCVAVTQMTGLFEKNIPTRNSLLGSHTDSSSLPSFLFGSFHLDREDQLDLCTRLLRREIQRCTLLLDRMSGIYQIQQQQQSGPINSSVCPVPGLLQEQWFLSSAGRLQKLVAAIIL